MEINGAKLSKKAISHYATEFLATGDVDALIKETGYTKNQLLYMFWNFKVNKTKVTEALCTTIEGDKIMAISDLHYGSTLENQTLVESAINTAIRKKIHVVINGGDLVQSTINNYDRRFPDIASQTEHALELYPRIHGIEHHLTLGNHDFNAFFKDPNYLAKLRERQDFKTIDFRRSYYKWGNFIFSVQHKCDSFYYVIPQIHSDFALQGHSHFFKVEDVNQIIMPTLSSDIKFAARPGFLILYNKGNEVQVEEYEFKKGRLTESPKVLTLTKR